MILLILSLGISLPPIVMTGLQFIQTDAAFGQPLQQGFLLFFILPQRLLTAFLIPGPQQQMLPAAQRFLFQNSPADFLLLNICGQIFCVLFQILQFLRRFVGFSHRIIKVPLRFRHYSGNPVMLFLNAGKGLFPGSVFPNQFFPYANLSVIGFVQPLQIDAKFCPPDIFLMQLLRCRLLSLFRPVQFFTGSSAVCSQTRVRFAFLTQGIPNLLDFVIPVNKAGLFLTTASARQSSARIQ